MPKPSKSQAKSRNSKGKENKKRKAELRLVGGSRKTKNKQKELLKLTKVSKSTKSNSGANKQKSTTRRRNTTKKTTQKKVATKKNPVKKTQKTTKSANFREESERLVRQRRRRPLLRRIFNTIMAILLLASIIFVVVGSRTGFFEKAQEYIKDRFFLLTVNMGFYIGDEVYVEGGEHIDKESIAGLFPHKGYGEEGRIPIFALSIPEFKRNLEAYGWVKEASVDRRLPGMIYIRITERIPAAIWQYKGELRLVDGSGAVIDRVTTEYQDLPIIVGEDANIHVGILLEFMQSEPELFERFSSAVRVGNRRWNINLNDDIEVKLPEENPQEAWHYLAKLQSEKRLLDRAIKLVDLRIPNRLYVEPEDGAFVEE